MIKKCRMCRKLQVDWTCKLGISEKICILDFFRIVTVDTWIVHFLSHQRLTYRNYGDHFTCNRPLLFLHWFKGTPQGSLAPDHLTSELRGRSSILGNPAPLPAPGFQLRHWSIEIWSLENTAFTMYCLNT